MILILILYTSLPVLLTAFSTYEETSVFYGGFALFLFQTLTELFLFKSKSKQFVKRGTVLLFFILSATTLLAGIKLNWSYFLLFLHLYQGPLLTVAFVIIHKLNRPHDFEMLSPGFNRIIILLISYAALMAMLLIRHLILGTFSYSDKELFFNFYGILNLLPPIYFLNMLRESSQSKLYMDRERIWLRNEEITSLFNSTEMAMLRRIFSGENRIRCFEMFTEINRNDSLKKGQCLPGDCKASICPAYSVIYRQIKSLDKKMRNLGLGRFLPPENKRDITKTGWLFLRERDVVIARKQSLPLKIPATLYSDGGKESSNAEGMGRKLFFIREAIVGLLFPFVIALSGSYILGLEFLSGRGLNPSSWGIASLVIAAPMIPALAKPSAKTWLAAITVPVLLPFTLLGSMGEEQVLFLSLKGLILVTVCVLARFPSMDRQTLSDSLKTFAPNALFWLIWFYMIAFSLTGQPTRSFASVIHGDFAIPRASMIFDNILLFLLFFLSARFFSLSRKPLTMKQDSILFKGRTLSTDLGERNAAILKEFIRRGSQPFHCYEILAFLDPAQISGPKDDCKPSSCSSYQKIYKRIQSIRKYLRTSGIGTIASPERKAASHREGWRLILHDDVFIELKD